MQWVPQAEVREDRGHRAEVAPRDSRARSGLIAPVCRCSKRSNQGRTRGNKGVEKEMEDVRTR